MWTGAILLHRPFIARWRPDLTSTELSTSPYDICLEAANRICMILEKYLERLPGGPCDMVFSIFTAASILLHHSKQVLADEAADTRRRLKQCIHWLSVLGRSWKIAGARHQLLNDRKSLPLILLASSYLLTPYSIRLTARITGPAVYRSSSTASDDHRSAFITAWVSRQSFESGHCPSTTCSAANVHG
jgi:hypothetical protein